MKTLNYNAGTAAPHHQGQVYCEETGKTVAVTFDDETGDKARLIAAAPEMLEALEALTFYINQDDDGDFFICKEGAQHVKNASIAIAKAKGE